MSSNRQSCDQYHCLFYLLPCYFLLIMPFSLPTCSWQYVFRSHSIDYPYLLVLLKSLLTLAMIAPLSSLCCLMEALLIFFPGTSLLVCVWCQGVPGCPKSSQSLFPLLVLWAQNDVSWECQATSVYFHHLSKHIDFIFLSAIWAIEQEIAVWWDPPKKAFINISHISNNDLIQIELCVS